MLFSHTQSIASDDDSCCTRCAKKPMALARVIPGAGPYPELRTFQCLGCGHIETIEAE